MVFNYQLKNFNFPSCLHVFHQANKRRTNDTKNSAWNKGIEIGKTADFLLKFGIKCLKIRFL